MHKVKSANHQLINNLVFLGVSCLVMGVLAVLLATCFAPEPSLPTANTTIVTDYQQVEFPEVFTDASLEEILRVTNPENNANAIVLFAFSSCPWCQKTIPVLAQAAKFNGIDNIYYYNPQTIRENNSPQYQQIVSYLASYLEADDQDQPRIYVPHVFFIKNGQVQNHNLGSLPSDEEASASLTIEQKVELQTIFRGMMNQWQTTN